MGNSHGVSSAMDLPLNLANICATQAHLPLNRALLLGAHNCGSYAFTEASALSPESNHRLTQTLRHIPGVSSVMKATVFNWGTTQACDIFHMLTLGVRYFDLRLWFNPTSQQWVLVHGLAGATLDRVVADLNAFIADFPTEIALVYIKTILPAVRELPAAALDALEHALLRLPLVLGSSFAPTMPLGAIHQLGNVVLFMGDADRDVVGPKLQRLGPLGYLLPGSMVRDPWGNCPTVARLEAFLLQNIAAAAVPPASPSSSASPAGEALLAGEGASAIRGRERDTLALQTFFLPPIVQEGANRGSTLGASGSEGQRHDSNPHDASDDPWGGGGSDHSATATASPSEPPTSSSSSSGIGRTCDGCLHVTQLLLSPSDEDVTRGVMAQLNLDKLSGSDYPRSLHSIVLRNRQGLLALGQRLIRDSVALTAMPLISDAAAAAAAAATAAPVAEAAATRDAAAIAAANDHRRVNIVLVDFVEWFHTLVAHLASPPLETLADGHVYELQGCGALTAVVTAACHKNGTKLQVNTEAAAAATCRFRAVRHATDGTWTFVLAVQPSAAIDDQGASRRPCHLWNMDATFVNVNQRFYLRVCGRQTVTVHCQRDPYDVWTVDDGCLTVAPFNASVAQKFVFVDKT